MNWIKCNKEEFEILNKKVHTALCKDKKYKETTTMWADINTIPKKGDIYLFPVKDRAAKILTATQRKRIVKIKSGDKDWFPEDETI